MVNLNIYLEQYQNQLRTKVVEDKSWIFDLIRKKYVRLNPEELVRQILIQYILHNLNWSKNLIAVEKSIQVGLKIKRFDILLYQNPTTPKILVECKSPSDPIRQKHFDQVLQYNIQLGVPYIWLSNGHENYVGKIVKGEKIEFLNAIDELKS